jgi:hypothetical protein
LAIEALENTNSISNTMNPTQSRGGDEPQELEDKNRRTEVIHKSIKEHYHKSGENLRAIQEERRII